MKLLLQRLLLIIIGCTASLYADPLIMLFDTQKAETPQTPFYVSYQLATALYQEPCPIFISSSLLRNIIDRADIFSQKVLDKNTTGTVQDITGRGSIIPQVSAQKVNDKNNIEYSIQQLWVFISSYLQKMDNYISTAQTTFTKQWVNQYFPNIANADPEQYKQAAFNFLCGHIIDVIKNWNIYTITPHFLLLVPPALQNDPRYSNLARATYDKINGDKPSNKKEISQALSIVIPLFTISPLNVYVSGHGEYASGKNKGIIAGLQAEDFAALLDQLQKSNTVNSLVYNSCYGGGKNTIFPYQDQQLSSKKFAYTIINISITDAPTYTYGYPEGMKLPPYDENKYLLPTDLPQDGTMKFCFLQDFPKFFSSLSNLITNECIESVNPYVYCKQNICSISHVENVPLILKPGSTHFVPFDQKYINQTNGVTLLDKNSYVSLDLGADQKLLPMLLGNYWYRITNLQCSTQEDISQFMQRVFLFIPDLMTPFVIYIPTLNLGNKIYQQVVLLHQVDIAPKSANCKILLYYEFSGSCYAGCFDNNAWKIIPVDVDVQNNMREFIKLADQSLNQEIKQQLDAIKEYYENIKLTSLFSSQCEQKNICKKLAD